MKMNRQFPEYWNIHHLWGKMKSKVKELTQLSMSDKFPMGVIRWAVWIKSISKQNLPLQYLTFNPG